MVESEFDRKDLSFEACLDRHIIGRRVGLIVFVVAAMWNPAVALCALCALKCLIEGWMEVS